MSACQLVTHGVPTWKSLCLTWIRDISTQLEKSPWVCCQGWEWKPWNLGLSAIIARLGSNTFSICFRHDGFSWTKILGGAKKLLHNILYIFYYTLILDCPWHFFLKQAYYLLHYKTHIRWSLRGVSILVPWFPCRLNRNRCRLAGRSCGSMDGRCLAVSIQRWWCFKCNWAQHGMAPGVSSCHLF